MSILGPPRDHGVYFQQVEPKLKSRSHFVKGNRIQGPYRNQGAISSKGIESRVRTESQTHFFQEESRVCTEIPEPYSSDGESRAHIENTEQSKARESRAHMQTREQFSPGGSKAHIRNTEQLLYRGIQGPFRNHETETIVCLKTVSVLRLIISESEMLYYPK